MGGADVLFLIFAVATCLGAIAVVVSQNVVRMAFWLMISLGSVAGLFFLLHADFVAATQLLIYVGGTVVLLVFGVMLTASGRFIKIQTSPAEGFLAAGIGSLFLAMIFSTVASVNWSALSAKIDPEFQLAKTLANSDATFRKTDKNDDGFITRDELPEGSHAAFDGIRSRLSKDELSPADVERVREQRKPSDASRKQPVEAVKPVHADPHSVGRLLLAIPDEQAFAELDKDEDGRLTRDEVGEPLASSFDAALEQLGKQRLSQKDFGRLLIGGGYNDPSQGNTARLIGLAFLGPRVDRDLGQDEDKQLSTGYLLPFEIISVHLLVVLIGAAYLARAKRRVSAAELGETGMVVQPAEESIYASFGQRFAAYLLDSLLIIVVEVAAVFLLLPERATDPPAWFFFVVGIAAFLYFAVMESSVYQGTVGKILLNIVVTDMDGNRISFARAVGRTLGKQVSGAILAVGYLIAAFTKRRQALHDFLAKTLVMKR